MNVFPIPSTRAQPSLIESKTIQAGISLHRASSWPPQMPSLDAQRLCPAQADGELTPPEQKPPASACSPH